MPRARAKVRCRDCSHAREERRPGEGIPHWECRKGHLQGRRMTTIWNASAGEAGYQSLRRPRVCPDFDSMDE